MMTPDTHPSLADQAYQRLRQKIFDFELMPGDRISESDLARKVQLGRTPLRQALLRLSYDGFVESLPKVGWQVAAIDFDKIDELYDFRILIECDAVRRLCAAATARRTAGDIDRHAGPGRGGRGPRLLRPRRGACAPGSLWLLLCSLRCARSDL